MFGPGNFRILTTLRSRSAKRVSERFESSGPSCQSMPRVRFSVASQFPLVARSRPNAAYGLGIDAREELALSLVPR